MLLQEISITSMLEKRESRQGKVKCLAQMPSCWKANFRLLAKRQILNLQASSTCLYREGHWETSMAEIQLEWELRLIPSIEEGVGMGQQGDDHNPSLNCNSENVSNACNQSLTLLQRLWLWSSLSAPLILTPFWDACLSARKCLITFEYKGKAV